MDDFRAEFRKEMDALRRDFQEDKLSGNCDINIQRGVRRERRNGEYRENELEFHRDSLTELVDKDEGECMSHKIFEGGN
jgi:hypothetical protein